MRPADSVPAIAVVVPTHNRADLLPRALRSVLAQGFRDFELLVVDDASEDATPKVLAGIADPRLRSLRHSRGAGAAVARNTGIRNATAPLIAFLDDDDELLPGFLDTMVQAFGAALPDVGFGWCGLQWVFSGAAEPGPVREETWAPSFANREAAYRSFLRSRRIGSSGLTVRAGSIDEIGGFDEHLAKAEDTDLLIRLARHFDFLVAPQVLMRIHLHDGPHLRTYDRRAADAYRVILRKNADTLAEDPALSATLHYKLAWLSYHSGDRRAGRDALLTALRGRPWFLKGWLALPLFEILGVRALAIHRRCSQALRRLRR
ncbi:MAG TPA: glycosyltransferase family 2 protein [Thermoanaerobaculia bacterium]|nr:glycosyltransferase family 2 protein [Thermoanaerobaculia bacterium]